MSRRRRLALLVLGGGALGVLALFSPWIYQQVRCEVLVRRLEGGDPSAADELAQERFAKRLLARLVETGERSLTRPLVALAGRGLLDAGQRRELFDRAYPASFTEQVLPSTPPGRADGGHRFVARTNGSVWELVDARPWELGSHRITVPTAGGVQSYMEWFVTGDGDGARCLFQRCTWVLYPPGARTMSERFRTESEDLTDVPDPLNLYLAQPRPATLPGGEPALELKLGSMGTWRQLVARRRLFERSVSYGLFLDRGHESPPREPLHLADVAVSAETATGRWFARDALRDAPIPNMDRGAHYTVVTVPRSAARLEPFQRLRIRFEPAPQYATSQGFEAPAANGAPFVREYYLPPPLAGQ